MINAPKVRSTDSGLYETGTTTRGLDGAESVPSFRPLRKHSSLEYHIWNDVMSTLVTWTRKVPVGKKVVQNLRQS